MRMPLRASAAFYPLHCRPSRECGFRRLRPCNPIEGGHAFRSKAVTFSDEGDRAPLPARNRGHQSAMRRSGIARESKASPTKQRATNVNISLVASGDGDAPRTGGDVVRAPQVTRLLGSGQDLRLVDQAKILRAASALARNNWITRNSAGTD
jgi:hypothetical protein